MCRLSSPFVLRLRYNLAGTECGLVAHPQRGVISRSACLQCHPWGWGAVRVVEGLGFRFGEAGLTCPSRSATTA